MKERKFPHYDRTLSQFSDAVCRIINEALEPYRHQLTGVWNSARIGNSIKAGFESFVSRVEMSEDGDATRDEIHRICKNMAAEIDDCICSYWQEKNRVYVVDFSVYSSDIENEILAIYKRIN